MRDRMETELRLLRQRYAEVEATDAYDWIRIFPVRTGDGWSSDPVAVAFQVPAGFPATPPYGFFVPAGLTFRGTQPGSFQPRPSIQPPFPRPWAMFSWQHDGGWRPTGDLVTGSNLLNWTRTFALRFAEGI